MADTAFRLDSPSTPARDRLTTGAIRQRSAILFPGVRLQPLGQCDAPGRGKIGEDAIRT